MTTASSIFRDEHSVPAVIERASVYYLEWLGFNEPTARELSKIWKALQPIDIPRSELLDIAQFRVQCRMHSLHDGLAGKDDDLWYIAMGKMGIADELQRAIILPQCRNMRMVISLKTLLDISFQMREDELLKIIGVDPDLQRRKTRGESEEGRYEVRKEDHLDADMGSGPAGPIPELW